MQKFTVDFQGMPDIYSAIITVPSDSNFSNLLNTLQSQVGTNSVLPHIIVSRLMTEVMFLQGNIEFTHELKTIPDIVIETCTCAQCCPYIVNLELTDAGLIPA